MASFPVKAPVPSDGLACSDAATSLAAVCAATSTETASFTATTWPHPHWQVSAPPPTTSSATTCPRPSRTATSTEVKSTVAVPWPHLQPRSRGPLFPLHPPRPRPQRQSPQSAGPRPCRRVHAGTATVVLWPRLRRWPSTFLPPPSSYIRRGDVLRSHPVALSAAAGLAPPPSLPASYTATCPLSVRPRPPVASTKAASSAAVLWPRP